MGFHPVQRIVETGKVALYIRAQLREIHRRAAQAHDKRLFHRTVFKPHRKPAV